MPRAEIGLMGCLKERFWAKVEKTDGCWLWRGCRTGGGYGRFYLDARHRSRKAIGAHRFAYLTVVGPVAEGLELDHVCRNRLCVNPGHLEPVTSSENKRRSPLVGRSPAVNHPGGNNGNGLKTHCLRGHAFTAENTYVDRRGYRNCRTCHLARSHDRWTRRRTG